MRFGIVKSTHVWDEGNTPAERHTVDVETVFGVDRSVLYEFLDALRPAVEGARREPILALLDYSARVGDEELIVRCRDCKHCVADPEPIDHGWPLMCDDTGRDMLDPDGFCSWGERRENDEGE